VSKPTFGLEVIRGATLFVAVSATIAAAQPAGPVRQFAPGAFNWPDQLPPGRFRSQIERLPQPARDRAIQWLRSFHFTDADTEMLNTDPEGGVFYADTFETPAETQEAEPETGGAPVPVSPFPEHLIFHSKPGAPNVLYLNFCGENVTGTAWNNTLNRTVIPALPFSTDTDYSAFSDSEQLAIKRIWLRVAEDFAPFDIDVTTERPAVFNSRTAHVLITRNTDANGADNPSSSAGGVAYVNVFAGGNYAYYRPAWVYHNKLSNSEANIAEAASHEAGHNLGLSHDGKTDGAQYYGGHGSGEISWGPIMGTGYGRNVSQWSKGEYYLANNTQDDLAIIAGKIAYRADDHGNTAFTATPLVLTGGTNIVSTTPDNDPWNTNPANKGVLESGSDTDVFSFISGNGPVRLAVTPWVMPSGTRGGNLDLLLQLRDQSGALLLAADPPTQTGATLQTNLSEGVYYLYVRNTSAGSPMTSPPSGYTAYGSLGQYFINGYVTATGFVPPPAAQFSPANLSEAGAKVHLLTVVYSGSRPIDVSTIDDADIRVTGPNGYDRMARLVSVDSSSNGSPRTATYAVDPPDSISWRLEDNGVYTVRVESGAVADIGGEFVPEGELGQFAVSVPAILYAADMETDPGWTLEPLWQYGVPSYSGPGPTGGFTGSRIVAYNLSGNYENRLSVKYATTPIVDCSGAQNLSLRFRRWLRVRNDDIASIQISVNGADWTTIWSGHSISDTGWQAVELPLPAWASGSASLQIRWGLSSSVAQSEIGWNIDDVQLVAGQMSTAPTVQLVTGVNRPDWGDVTPASASFTAGSTVQLLARPNTHFRFLNWSGDLSGTNNPVTLTLTSNVTVQANFAELLTTNHPTPYWWLASYGPTNDFEALAESFGANGIPLWQSYVAGLDPSDPESRFTTTLERSGDDLVLRWNTVTGRVYTVWSSTNALTGFAPVDGAIRLPPGMGSFTNPPDAPATFFRVQVEKP